MHATQARKAADAQGATKKIDCTIYRLADIQAILAIARDGTRIGSLGGVKFLC